MVRINSRLFFLLPLLYLGIFFFLVIFQFSKNEQFSQSLGDLTISGKASSGQEKDEVVDLNIQGKGISISLSANSPVLLETTDGTIHRARARSYQVNASRQTITVNFQHNIQVQFRLEGKKLTILSQIQSNAEAVRSLSLPLSAQEVPGSSPENLPGMEIRSNGQRGFLTLSGAGDSIDRAKGYVIIKAQKGWLHPVVLDQSSTTAGSALEAWLFEKNTPPSISALALGWTDFWTKAFSGWQTGRFTTAGLWERGGEPGYTPALGLAYMTEAGLRNLKSPANERVTAAAKVLGNGYLDAAYTGNIVEAHRQKRREMEVLLQKINTGSPVTWAENPLLIRDAYYHGPAVLYSKLKALLLTSPLPAGSTEGVSLLANLAALRLLDKTDVKDRVNKTFELLIRNVTKFQGMAYLVNERGYMDLLDTAEAGLALEILGNEYKETPWLTLATALQSTALSQAAANGLIPRILITEKGVLLRKEGNVYPEDLYVYQTLGKSPPGDISLSNYWGPGAFIKTTSAYSKIDVTPTAARITFQQSVGTTHHTIIQNVPPFDHIKLHDIRWRPDPQFQLYSDGYFYNEATKTLYVKNTHRVETEILTIQFLPDAPVP